jgi:acyl carrier protein
MGLETVEIVIRFEEAFGITISDEVASHMSTPRDVTDYVLTQVATAEQSACLSQQAFYFLRRSFYKRLQFPRTAFHPDVPLQTLIPKGTRKDVWRQLQTEMGTNALPPLARPVWLFYSLVVGIIVLAVFVSYATPGIPFQLRLIMGIALLVAVGFTVSLATRPLKTAFRRRFQTIGGLVEHLLLYTPHTFKREQRVWTRAQIAETVRAIIVDVTGKKNFTEDSHFINDMRLG